MPTKPNRTRAISQPAGRQRTHAPGAPRPLASPLQPIPTPASRGPPLHPPSPACLPRRRAKAAGGRARAAITASPDRTGPTPRARPRSHASPSCALRPRVAIPSTTVRGNGAGSLAAHPQPRGEAKGQGAGKAAGGARAYRGSVWQSSGSYRKG